MGSTFFDILRLKTAYESKIFDTTKRSVIISIDQSHPKGEKNIQLFTKLLDRLRLEKIDQNVFLSVMFDGLAWPRRIFKGQSLWKYPYLILLSSDAGIRMFQEAYQSIDKMFGSETVADEYIKANYPIKYETQFKNCFYEGFSLMVSTIEQNGEDFLNDVWNLFSAFYAFNDLFTPAFFITHSRWSEVVNSDTTTLPLEIRELKALLLRHTRAIVLFCRKNPVHRKYLLRARAVIAKRELESVKKFSSLAKTPAERKKAWNQLI